MNPQDLLIRHVEKLVVALVALICGWALYDTATNTDIRFLVTGDKGTQVDAKTITDGIKTIGELRPNLNPPVLKQPREYAQEMQDGFARVLPHRPFMAWLTAHPDFVVTVQDPGHYFYLYELLPPQVEIKDAIGNLELTFTMPSEVRPKEGRLADAAKHAWTNKKGAAEIVNSVERSGLIVEMRTGDKGQWQVVKAAGQIVGGVLPADKLGETIIVRDVQASEKYAFRCRLVAKATGYDFVAANTEFTDILVATRRIVPEDQTFQDWETLKKKVLPTPADKDRVAALGFQLGTAIPGPRPSLRQYLSEWSPEIEMRAKSSTRFALERLSVDPANPDGPPTVVLALNKLFRNKAGDQQKWLPKPFEFKHKPGDTVGGQIPHADLFEAKGPKVEYDLRTPFVIDAEKLEKGVTRVLYWQLFTKNRDGSPGKTFELRPRELKNTDRLLLKNTKKADETLQLYKLTIIPKPTNVPIYPEYRFGPTGFDEGKEFEKNPGGFEQYLPDGPKPVAHQPGTGPLAELNRRGKPSTETDVPYYVFPDGRLYYYEHKNNKKVLQEWVPGKEPKGAAPLPPPPGEEPPADAAPASDAAAPSAAAPTPAPAPGASPKPAAAPVAPPPAK